MDRWLNHPTAVKLIALVLGILMWAVVHYQPPEATTNNFSSLIETQKIDNVKVLASGLDERNYTLLSLDPQTVSLTVQGSRSDFLRAANATEDYKVQVDLSSVVAGKNTLPLKVELPSGIQLVQNGISSSEVDVFIEALLTKEFEVGIVIEGSPATGFKAGTPIVKPGNRVHVTLPENQLTAVDRVGATISVEGEQETLKNMSVKLAAYDVDGKVIEDAVIDPAVIEIEVPITNPFKTVPLQFKLIGRMPIGLSIASFKPDVEQVTIYGPQNELDKIDFIETEIEIDELQNSGKIAVPLKIAAPILEVTPKQVEINIEVVLSGTRTLEGLVIDYNDLGDELTATITEPSTGKADITIQGAPAILDRLQPGDVDVIADLSGKGPGTYTVPLIVNVPRFIEQSGGTNSIIVEITSNVPATLPDGVGNVEEGEEVSTEDSGEGTGNATVTEQ